MKITIIPHNISKVSTINIGKTTIILLFILLMIPLVARFFYPRGLLDSSKLEEHNKQLEQNLQKHEEEYKYISNKYENLLSKAFASGNFKKASDNEEKASGSNNHRPPPQRGKHSGMFHNIEGLLEELESAKNVIGKVESKLQSEQMIAIYVPSCLPVKGCVVQTFGKTHYVFTGEERVSQGIDISASQGSKVCATGGGIVEFAGLREHSGLMVVINHGYGLKTVYSHLAFLKVSRGQTVKRGNEIGLVGKTGKAIGSVLHYEVWLNDKAKNPLDYVLQPVEFF